MGELLAGSEMQYTVNGLLSLTPDAQQVLGETAEVEKLWSAAAVWVKEGPGTARLIAEWITHGHPRLCDPHGSDVTRFYPHERTGRHIRRRCREHFNKTYGIVHPREQWASGRGMNRAPFHDRTAALGAEFHEARGWERPQWYASNADLPARYAVADRPHEWDRRWWSPIINAEHLHLRDKVGIVDLSAFQIFDVSGPGAVPYLERLAVNRCDVPVGRAVYTPLLTPDGGIRADLTIQRLAGDRFRIVTGAFDGARDEVWFRRHLPADGSVQFENRSSALCTIGVWGPDARALLSTIADVPLSQEAFPYGTVQEAIVDGVPATMLRISYVGESGWGDLHGHAVRRAPVGRDPRGGPRPRRPAGGHRRLRHHGPAGEGLRAHGGGPRLGVLAGRGGPGAGRGEGRRLHRQAGLPGGARRGAGREAAHADHGQPHRRVRDAPLSHRGQRTDPDARRRANRGRPRPRVARHLRRHGAVRRQVPSCSPTCRSSTRRPASVCRCCT